LKEVGTKEGKKKKKKKKKKETCGSGGDWLAIKEGKIILFD